MNSLGERQTNGLTALVGALKRPADKAKPVKTGYKIGF
jgi:hypothetical protein